MAERAPPDMPKHDAMLPEVMAQIFISTPDARAIIQSVRGELSFKNLTWLDAGTNVDDALAYLQTAESGHILLIEKDRPLSDFIASLRALSANLDTQTRIFVIGRTDDELDAVAAYREMMEVGVADFILIPTDPLRLHNSLVEAFISESRPKLGTSVAFIGAGSGNGSSTVAQNVGYAMAEILGHETLLADLDPHYGTLAINFNLTNPTDLLALEHSAEEIDYKVLWHTAERIGKHLLVLPTLPDLSHEPDIARSVISAVLEIPYQHEIYLVIDVPDVWTEAKRELLKHVDRIVIVAEPTMSGIQNIENAKRALQRMDYDLDRASLVINRARQPGRTELPVEEISTATGFEVRAVLVYDPRLLGEADAAGASPLAISEGRPLSRAVIALAGTLVDHGNDETPAPFSRLGRLLRKWW